MVQYSWILVAERNLVDNGRSRLVRLSADDVERLLDTLPTLYIVWAGPAKVSKDLLAQKQPKAVRAVQAGLRRNVDAFIDGLAFAGVLAFAGDHDYENAPRGPEGGDVASLVAEAASTELGDELGALLVTVIAGSDLAIAPAMLKDASEPLVSADDAAVDDKIPAPEGTTNQGSAEPRQDKGAEAQTLTVGIIGSPDVPVATARAPRPSVEVTPLHLRLAHVEELRTAAGSIASRLRESADSIEQGVIPPTRVDALFDEVDTWVSQAGTLLVQDQSLEELALALHYEMRRQSEELRDLKSLAEGARSLISAGHPHFAEELLAPRGFIGLDALLDEINAMQAVVDGGGGSAGVGGGAPWPAGNASRTGAAGQGRRSGDLQVELAEPVAAAPVTIEPVAAPSTDDDEPVDDGPVTGKPPGGSVFEVSEAIELPLDQADGLAEAAGADEDATAGVSMPGADDEPGRLRPGTSGVGAEELPFVGRGEEKPPETSRHDASIEQSTMIDAARPALSKFVSESLPEPHTKDATRVRGGEIGASDTARILSDQSAPLVEHDADTTDAASTQIISRLVADGRETLAVLAAATLDDKGARVRELRLFAGAFGSRADTLLVQEPDIVLEDSQERDLNADDNRVLFAAYARMALELGYSPVGSLERFRQGAALDEHPAGEIAVEIVRLTTRGFKRPLGAVELTAIPDDWLRLAGDATQQLASLRSMSITYQRASRIAHYLVRANQPLGGGLEACSSLARKYAQGQAPSSDEWAVVEALLADLQDDQRRNRILNEADRALSTPQQLRNPIIASARDRLSSKLDEVEALLAEALSLRARHDNPGSGDDPQGMADLVAIVERAKPIAINSVGDAALQRLIDWVRADNAPPLPPVQLTQLISDELLPLFEISRDAAGSPDRLIPSRSELDLLIEGRDPITVFRGYLAVGNITAAEQYATRAGVVRTDAIDDEVAQATQVAARGHARLVSEVERLLDRLQSLNDEELVRQLTQQLDEHRTPQTGRYDLHARPLSEIRERGEKRLETIRVALRERVALVPERQDAERVLALLESQDEQLALDYLTLAEVGEPLPELPTPTGDDFGEFFPAVVRVAEGATRQRVMDNLSEVRRHLGAVKAPQNRMLNQGLKSWIELAVDGHAGHMTEGRLANILRMLGLIPASDRWLKELTKARYAGYASYVVKANPIDRSYIPSLGTQALGTFDLTVVWDEVSPQRLLQLIDTNRRTQPNVILYMRTLSVEQRLDLRKITTRRGADFSPLVVDMPVIAWLSAREEPAWRLTQRVTLPFTTLNPYTPFAGGEVPDEVFVGRDAERREIIDPTGSMFVYGGRQLGKSALLRRVERGIMAHRGDDTDVFDHGQVAVYLDLKAEGIGEAAAPAALWGALAPRLQKAGVLPLDLSGDVSADSIAGGIFDWLEGDASRRLLLLLDEADNFLTLDAQDSGPSRMGSFPVLQRLKGLMERTGRRFKPVFAGLHQVQRFHDLPNTPVVHGGQDILIGPLTSADARELVRDPLYALGYEFETQDTMWRLLRLTNYQASLIQIICEALVRHMRTAALPAAGGRVKISNRDVDDVYAKREVRDLIAQRFRWTINLDNRYKVIALVTALRSLDSKPGERFRANELHDDCEFYWSAGFLRSTLSGAEFLRYLDEMKGLGVLHRQGEEFGLRSPSILSLLGSRETIEGELLEASQQLEVSYQYNPTMNRRVLRQDASGAETRSPLPDSELAELLSADRSSASVHAVIGTAALGLDRVLSAIEKAGERQLPVRFLGADATSDQLDAEGQAHVVVDLTGANQTSRDAALEIIASRRAGHTIVILPAAFSIPPEIRPDWCLHYLERWSVQGLQSWNESPFFSPSLRQELRDVTGGWPALVEEAIALVMRGASTEAALAAVTTRLRQPEHARHFVKATGVPTDVVETWWEWFGKGSAISGVTLLPATLDDLDTAYGVDAHPIVEGLQRLGAVDEMPEGWSVDRVVLEAVLHINE